MFNGRKPHPRNQAERQRVFVWREGSGTVDVEEEVKAIEIGGQFLFDVADHRDFLGSILGTGITRDGVRGSAL